MFARSAALVAVMIVAIACPSLAADTRSGPDPSVGTINRHLETIVDVSSTTHAAASEQPGPPVNIGVTGIHQRPAPPPLFGPTIMSMVAHFNSAERILHFKTHGLDANLWGVFNGGRGINVKYSVRF